MITRLIVDSEINPKLVGLFWRWSKLNLIQHYNLNWVWPKPDGSVDNNDIL